MDYKSDVHNIKCPKCQHGMEEVTLGEVTIDRCTHCHGLWFDADEAHRLKELPESHLIDHGDPTEGWKWDSRPDIVPPS